MRGDINVHFLALSFGHCMTEPTPPIKLSYQRKPRDERFVPLALEVFLWTGLGIFIALILFWLGMVLFVGD
jgi:hypothetical protein